MESGRFVLQFDEVGEAHGPLVGNKGLRLAQMAQAGLPVLPGFCVTTTAYRFFLSHNRLEASVTSGDQQIVRERVTGGEFPSDVASAILEAYKQLNGPVAVRSSATVEDSQDASFAGQYDTFLNIKGAPMVLDRVRDCWAGLWSERALHGRTREDRYEGLAEYDTLRAIREAVRLPLFANGDIDSPARALAVLAHTGADGVMFGRAAQGRPWIFREIRATLLGVAAAATPSIAERP